MKNNQIYNKIKYVIVALLLLYFGYNFFHIDLMLFPSDSSVKKVNLDSIADIQNTVIELDRMMIDSKIVKYTIEGDSLFIQGIKRPVGLVADEGIIPIPTKRINIQDSFLKKIFQLYMLGLFSYSSYTPEYDASSVSFVRSNTKLIFSNEKWRMEKIVKKGHYHEISFFRDDKPYGLNTVYYNNGNKVIETFRFDDFTLYQNVWEEDGSLIFSR